MLKIGIIGAGQTARAHVAGYRDVENVEVVAIADIDLERAQCLAEELGADALEHGDKVFDREDIDVVDICLPTYLHHEYVLKAAKAKKHIICRAPIALSLEEAREMIDAAKDAKVKFMVAHKLRFSPKYISAKKATEDGSIGTAKTLRAYRGSPHFGRRSPWYKDIAKSGGAILNLAIEDIDFLRWCFGPVKEVYGKGNIFENREYFEYDMLTLEFESGLIGHVTADWAKPEGTLPYESLDISGEIGTIKYESKDEYTLGAIYEGDEGIDISPESPVDKYSNPVTRMLTAFVDAVREDGELPVDPSEAMESLNVALCAMESIRDNRPVSIKEGF